LFSNKDVFNLIGQPMTKLIDDFKTLLSIWKNIIYQMEVFLFAKTKMIA